MKRLEELRNLALHSDGAVVGRDFLEVILRQMEFSYALSQRSHRDVQELHQSVKRFTESSSKRVEKLTNTGIDRIDRRFDGNDVSPDTALGNNFFYYFANALSLPLISRSLDIAGWAGSARITSYQMFIPSLCR